ncbi:HlyD family secretion protein [Catenovulum sp. 2E275]|uniref:HlyD family secretion protein n=1 Tax=Catenovulum sp. 2E275 TaxID=2980497 RepID=UPI0021D38D14|nr:HlyD family secretion protein [Catenovulum sp. 2E275]MCU4675938.1 HlyD family secretion protein [Catenovulum sp. 2E275]
MTSLFKNRAVLMLGVPLILVVIIGYIYLSGGHSVSTDNAYVKANKLAISALVSGAIVDTYVTENQLVTTGQPLFSIDSKPYEIEKAKAEAGLAKVKTDLLALKASYQEKLADIELAQKKYEYAVKDEQRLAKLNSQQLISQTQYEQAQEDVDIQKQSIKVLKQDLTRISALLADQPQAELNQYPDYLAKQAELEQAELNLSRCVVKASVNGVVSLPPEVGQFVATGKSAMTLVTTEDLWVEANFTEKELTHVHPGQSVTIHVDTFPDFVWQGKVESLSPATQSEYSLLPAQNATGNWVKIAQRVPVRIKLEQHQTAPRLLAGLSSVVEIETGVKRQLFGFTL